MKPISASHFTRVHAFAYAYAYDFACAYAHACGFSRAYGWRVVNWCDDTRDIARRNL
jgi:hypothetical protein